MNQREKVLEWRITTEHYGCKVRYWMESDPEFGGKSLHETKMSIDSTEETVLSQYNISYPYDTIIDELKKHLPSVNSIEITNFLGNGSCIHWDWP